MRNCTLLCRFVARQHPRQDHGYTSAIYFILKFALQI